MQNSILSKIVELLAISFSFLKPLEFDDSEKKYAQKITNMAGIISITYLIIDIIPGELIKNFFHFLISKNGIIYLAVYTLILAITPSFVSRIERNNKNAQKKQSSDLIPLASDDFFRGNLIFNLLGATISIVLFYLSYLIGTNDFSYWDSIPVKEILALFIPLCAYIALAYQNIEQRNKSMIVGNMEPPIDVFGNISLDHDPSLIFLNQRINMYHLINVYFISFTSSLFVFSHTLYYKANNIILEMKWEYYVFITIALFFFYMLGFHEHQHLYITFVLVFPAIMSSVIFLFSWFKMNNTMFMLELIFILLHTLIYCIIILRRNKIIYKNKDNNENNTFNSLHIFGIILKHSYYMIVIVTIILLYFLAFLFPKLL